MQDGTEDDQDHPGRKRDANRIAPVLGQVLKEYAPPVLVDAIATQQSVTEFPLGNSLRNQREIIGERHTDIDEVTVLLSEQEG